MKLYTRCAHASRVHKITQTTHLSTAYYQLQDSIQPSPWDVASVSIEWLTFYTNMNNVYLIKGALSLLELGAFSKECDYHRNAAANSDLSDLGSAIDLFENSKLNDSHKARYNADDYFAERWRDYSPLNEDRETMRSFLLTKVPGIISKICNCEELSIFNESYIVKEAESQVAFRWHVDSEEQLGALLRSDHTEYFSVWCPLDNATRANGTLAFPSGTSLIEVELRDKSVEEKGSISTGFCEKSTLTSPQFNRNPDTQSDLSSLMEEDEGLLVEVEAGTVLLFSSNMWHRSGDNKSKHPRRILYVQYSPAMITSTAPSAQKMHSTTLEHSDNRPRENAQDYPLCFAVPCTPNKSDFTLKV